MKTLLTTFMLLGSTLVYLVPTSKAHDEVYDQILKNSPRIDKTFAKRLSKIIRVVSKKRKVPRRILSAILMQESSYRLTAVRKECGVTKTPKGAFSKRGCVYLDFGISQVYYKTANVYGFELNRLTSDLYYSVDAGAQVLSWFRRTYARGEPREWFARYNCGTAKSISRRSCKRYLTQVKRWM